MILPGSYTGQIKCPDAALAAVPKKMQLEHGKEKYGDTVLRQNIRKEEKQMKIGNKEFDLKNHAYVMGILNVTPDSFSDGGKWNDKGRANASYTGNDRTGINDH